MKYRVAILLVFALLALAAIPTFAQDGALLNIGTSDAGDTILVGPDGLTLYLFTPDDNFCVDQCLENWPPLTVESEDELTKAEGIPGDVGIFEREDGTMQVTYNGMPLYYGFQDEAPGDATGDTLGGVWFVVEPVTIYVSGNEDLGDFIVGPNGMTVYLFTPDDANCVDECLEFWPPLLVDSADDITVSRSLPGEIGTFEREDGLQVTYNGKALYYFQNDAAIGDATGEGANDVWFVVPPETVAVGGNDDLGEFLTDPIGNTLYLFTPDDANCVDQCLEIWPPYTVDANDTLVLPPDVPGELGTFERTDADGNVSLQVTYNGKALYYFQDDAARGDTNGQGANDVWFVVPPAE